MRAVWADTPIHFPIMVSSTWLPVVPGYTCCTMAQATAALQIVVDKLPKTNPGSNSTLIPVMGPVNYIHCHHACGQLHQVTSLDYFGIAFVKHQPRSDQHCLHHNSSRVTMQVCVEETAPTLWISNRLSTEIVFLKQLPYIMRSTFFMELCYITCMISWKE